MYRNGLIFAMCLLLVAGGRQVSAQVVISSLSSSTLPRSGRLLINGTGFGDVQGSSRVEIAGLAAPVTRWSDTLIAAYVPEATPVGTASVLVFANGTASNSINFNVTLRQANGRVRWRFQADSPYFFQRPAVGPDGTVIAHDAGGFVYALSPDGGLKWIYKTRIFACGPPSVGADGSVYVGDSTTITALSSTGALKWTFTHPGGRAIAAGPTVGPDGKIYAFFDVFNIYAFTPDGAVAWQFTSSELFDLFEYGAEMVFGPSNPGQPADQVYLSFGVSPSGYLWAWKMDTGALVFAHHQAATWESSMQPQGQAITAPDGTIYTACSVAIGSSSTVNAFSPDGTLKWQNDRFGGSSAPDLGPNGNIYVVYQAGHLGAINSHGTSLWNAFDGVNVLQYPIANPAGGMVFVGGGTYGNPGFVRAYSSVDGTILWQIDLGAENGGNQWLGSRPRFAADGQTVYFGTTIPTPATDNYCYLYAVDTSGTGSAASLSSLTFSPKSVVGGTSSTGAITLTGPAPSGGLKVTLKSNKSQVTVPASVTVPAGASSVTFTANTSVVTATLTASVSGTSNGVTRSGSLTVLTLLKSVAVSPSSVVGGKPAKGTVNLNGPAPAGGLSVALSTTNGAASVPGSVLVAAGATTATFVVNTSPVSANTTGTISATALGVTKSSGILTVKPPALSSLALSPSSLKGGGSVTGTVKLTGTAAVDTLISLTNANTLATFSNGASSASVTVKAGSSSAAFTMDTHPTSVTVKGAVTATLADVTKSVTLTVNP